MTLLSRLEALALLAQDRLQKVCGRLGLQGVKDFPHCLQVGNDSMAVILIKVFESVKKASPSGERRLLDGEKRAVCSGSPCDK